MGPQKETAAGGGEFQGAYDESGVDLSLIRAMLALSPPERLRQMERSAHQTRVLNEYGRRHRQARADSSR
jgi:hypothetical protein